MLFRSISRTPLTSRCGSVSAWQCSVGTALASRTSCGCWHAVEVTRMLNIGPSPTWSSKKYDIADQRSWVRASGRAGLHRRMCDPFRVGVSLRDLYRGRRCACPRLFLWQAFGLKRRPLNLQVSERAANPAKRGIGASRANARLAAARSHQGARVHLVWRSGSGEPCRARGRSSRDRKSTRLNSSHT